LFKKLAAAAPRQADAGISWRHLWRPTLQDYAELSPDFAKVLKDGLVDPSIMQGLTFEIPMWQNGQSVYHPLDSDGSDREITPANIKEFVEKAVTYVLRDSIKNQFTAFARGFHSICGGNALSLFRGEELELLVRGSEDFDLDTLRAAVLYDNWKRPGTKEDLQDEDDVKRDYPVVRMFWNYFESADIKERRRILRFVTGTDRLPPAGIVNLVIKVSRQEMGKGEFRYPSARTCFNQILLPDCFKEQAVFNRVFRNALDMAGTGFGMK
jgi:E3 ubiquitin-protein ligase HECTD2